MKRLVVVLLTCGALTGTLVPGVVDAESSAETEYRVLWAAQGSRESGDLIEVFANLARVNVPGDESVRDAWRGYGIVSVQGERCRVTTFDVTDLELLEDHADASLRWDSHCGLVHVEWQTDTSARPDQGDDPVPTETVHCFPDGGSADGHISQGTSASAQASGSVDELPFSSEGAFISLGKWWSAGCE